MRRVFLLALLALAYPLRCSLTVSLTTKAWELLDPEQHPSLEP